MASLQERLKNVYGNPKNKEEERHSWIPKRTATNPYEELKRSHGDGSLSSKRTEDLMREQEILGAAKIYIFEIVGLRLLNSYGEEDLEFKLQNFQKSWDTQFDRYGTIMVTAISELTIDMKFVNKDGQIRKVVLRNKVEEIKKREKNQ
ncbi:MAG: hypothetical protein UW41_C0010G0041 [Candidatus Collierbacteria bacterium GW2011_GWC2_44_18]|uniref:Uncharacterized protein n=2 Tax=Microgenomates group TaxID=1794810 RepID=A0A0G1LFP5_9BACT|nr:MAG: hypothetical protein UW16_C0004G0021 [Microgenomates group bacterium GW2011_GWC1_44_10]KKT49202.1 MAG: hypothetical protein UW41_C0010G0041 [Candidatus Collierbacteria bacterium GW2011_GWC2_44_18]KKT67507.1 MAG: hypothetical protein UW60_C0005G0021 [Candidatus Woesebacteria bacterium GW2011_GWA2_44_33]